MSVSLSKIGQDFSNKVVQKLTLEKNVLTKNGFLNWYSPMKKIGWFLTSKIDFECTILAVFDQA